MNDTPTPKTERRYKLAIYELPYDTNYRANYQVWKTVKILKGHMESFERELTAVTEQRDRLVDALEKAKALYTPSSKGEYQTGWHDAICWVGQQALQSLNQPDAVKGGSNES